MSTINSVTPFGGLTTAPQLQTRPPEIKGSAGTQTPASDTYTASQEVIFGAGADSSQAGAIDKYQKIARMGSRNRGGAQGEGVGAVEPQEGVSGPESSNQVARANENLTNPYQTQKMTNNMAAKPDAAIQSALSFYA